MLGRKVDLSSEHRAPAPFVVGVTRSGTTLLRLMLDAHPELTIPPETHFVPKMIKVVEKENATAKSIHRAFLRQRRWGDFDIDGDELLRRLRRLRPLDATAVLRSFYDLYAEGQEKPRWGDKTPGYQVRMRRISRALPEARFVHVIRDGRDVVLSQWSKAEHPTPVEEAAKRWQQRVRLARNLARKMPHLYMEMRYEDLVRDPEPNLRRVCELVKLDFDPAMLSHHERAGDRLREIAKDLPAQGGAHELDAETRMAAHEMAARPPTDERLEVWRREMKPDDVSAFEQAAGETLRELGYELSGGERVKVGVVTKWFNRGQPVVGRYLRSALDELGHETFVLARPRREGKIAPGALSREGVWDQEGVTEASELEPPLAEYERWVEADGIEAVFCDQNYQFAELASLRRAGVTTIGRFVWEHFGAEHVAGARDAFDVVYSFTRAEQERYGELGIESPYVTWGAHPELVAAAVDRPEHPEVVTFIFPGGFLGHRKPLAPVVEAFRRTDDPRLRLLVKVQVARRHLREVEDAITGDDRIELLVADQPTDEHLRTFAACDACVSPARWEGLGLPLYEAMAFGMPAITNDVAPMNEAVTDGVNGVLVRSHPDGEARSGITAYAPDLDALAAAFQRVGDDAERARLAAGARALRDGERAWSHTVAGIGGLIESATSARMGAG